MGVIRHWVASGIDMKKTVKFSPESIFDLTCPDIGKPAPFRQWCWNNGCLIDYEVLQWLSDIKEIKETGFDMPKYKEFYREN